MTSSQRAINFSAGPSGLPIEVLLKSQEEYLNYAGSGVGVMELSHRSATFGKIIAEAEQDLRDVLLIPDNYSVLFMHGGGTAQFGCVPLNLFNSSDDVGDYLITGSWSDKAYKEAKKYGKANQVARPGKFNTIPDRSEWKMSPNAKYFYYCANETIHGVEFQDIPDIDRSIPLVADMSSNFLTRQFDVSKFGIVLAATQKNVGIAGLAIVIIRNDLIKEPLSVTQSISSYKIMKENKSLYNTPPCFAIYITGLYLKWMKSKGGLKAMEEASIAKSSLIYDLIEKSNGFLKSSVDKRCRSRVTIPFRICGPQAGDGDTNLEAKFLAEAEKEHFIQLKGHRSVGGIRASMFNAMSLQEAKKFAQFLEKFINP